VGNGIEAMGIRDGFVGRTENRTLQLDARTLAGILTVGGTILGTSRIKPHRMEMDGRFRDMRNAIVKNYERNGLDALVCIGGGGGGREARSLIAQGVHTDTVDTTI